MSHILIVYLFGALFISVVNVFLTAVLYKKKNHSRLLLYYLLFLSTQLFDNLSSAVFNYMSINVLSGECPPALFRTEEISDLIPLFLYFLFGALMINSLLGRNLMQEKKKIFFILSAISSLLVAASFFIERLSLIQALELVIYTMLLYLLYLFLIHISQIGRFQYVSVLRKVARISFVIFPLVILENIKDLLPLHFSFIGGFFGPTSYLIFNAYGLYYVSIYLFSSDDHLRKRKFRDIVRIYKITERESEVLEMVLDGASNGEISGRLFISEGTVKNYIYSVFRKVNVKSRIQLINFLRA